MNHPLFATMPRGRDRIQWLSTTLLLLACHGCGLDPTAAELNAQMEQFAAQGGYRSERTFHVRAARETWKHGYTALDISFIGPGGEGSFPLVVYLPGLGEDATAGRFWRRAWAEAGYAVMSVQPASLSGVLRYSERMNSGDLLALGRRYFAPPSLENRLAHVSWAVEELRRRKQSGDPCCSAADPTRIAVAGFDLGAQAASALAGEKVRTSVPFAPTFKPSAAILLSPYVAIADGSSPARFADVDLPVLAVTGTEDDDLYGITPAALRTEVWTLLPRGDKYLLSLRRGTRRVLSGRAPGGSAEDMPGTADPAGDGKETPSVPDALLKVHVQVDQYGGAGGGRSLLENREMMDPEHPGRIRRSDIRQLTIVRSVTTAFLDATIKALPLARNWLTKESAVWIGLSGSLKRK